MAKLMYIGTHGPDDPTKACMPFHLAVNGAAEAGSRPKSIWPATRPC